MSERPHKYVILSLAGFGDTLSLITRIPAMLKQHPNHQPVFYLGGYGASVKFSKEQLEREGYEANIIKNLSYHNQLPQMRDFIKSKVVGENDLFMDASFCEEIFQNQRPPFYEYEMQFPYEYAHQIDKSSDYIKSVAESGNCVAIHPLTKSGNAEGFESDVEKGRFWSREQWKQLCVLLIDAGYVPTFVGYGDEDWGLIEELTNEGHKVHDARTNVVDTMQTLKFCIAGIFCNSWDWEITARAGIPTFSFYTKNHFFIQNHVPEGPSDFWDNCFIETNPVQSDESYISGNDTAGERLMNGKVSAESVWDKLSYMIENKKRPEEKYSVCMITLNDEECVQKTLDNVKKYIVDDFVITDGGSTDNTLKLIGGSPNIAHHDDAYRIDGEVVNRSYEIYALHKLWDDDFSEQKNHSLNNAKNKWRVWIDADETYEHIFWNQLPWYIRDAEISGTDCINVPRINTITNLNHQEMGEYAQQVGWNLSFFGWINYPDYQQRIFTDQCKFLGRTHERIVGAKKEGALVGIHCVHPKTKERQDKGIKREEDQYVLEAKNVASKIASENPLNKPIVMHYVHHLGIGGTAKVVQILGKYFQDDPNFHHTLAYKTHGELERVPLFEEAFGKNNMVAIASIPEFYEVIKKVKPFIMHRQTGGNPEFPFVPEVKKYTKHFISTSIFAGIDRVTPLSRVIYISNYMFHYCGKFGGKLGGAIRQIGIPIEAPFTTEDLREELGIPKDSFVFGRLGRDSNDIFDPVNLLAFARVETENTYFVVLSPSDIIKEKAKEYGIRNIAYVDKTLDDVRISRFYNTIDVLAHSRRDGECNPGNIHESFAHGKPVISHYAVPYNGQVQEIGNCGFVVNKTTNFNNVWQDLNPSSLIDVMDYSRHLGMDNFTAEDRSNSIINDTTEYARIMQAFIDGDIDYDTLSKNCLENWENNCKPEMIAQQHIDLYKELK